MGPQRLWPMYPVDIARGRVALVLDQRAHAGRGEQAGQVHRHRDDRGQAAQTASLPLEVEVLPVTLLTMQQAELECGTCVTSFLPAQDLKALAESNHTGLDLWIHGTRPQMRIVDGKVQLDFTYLDDGMAWAKKYGMDHMMWFLGGDPYGFPNTASLERYLYSERPVEGKAGKDLQAEYLAKGNAAPEKVLPEIRDLLCPVGAAGGRPRQGDELAKQAHRPSVRRTRQVVAEQGLQPARSRAPAPGSRTTSSMPPA